ncbi:MAG: IS481 family transposase [Gemmatimonadetes bacterium]|nr:IS481 family transposase [Gemmatimonadota bacterium]MBT8477828.1 IS481 family transposase [Gemmatimonadota bacterium]NNF39423.1 IS481 family transposase [Gemmatimonadota bacterium]
MTTVQAEKIARRKLSLLQLAQELGNVSKACKIVGYSRQQFYEIRRNFQLYGADGLMDQLPGAKAPHPNRVSDAVEKAILDHGLEHPTHGAQRVADELMLRGIQVSSGGVRGVWSRHGLSTKHERLLRLEETAKNRKLKLTDEQIRALERFDPEFRDRHIEVHFPGDLVAVDTFFVGTLKGVGKVYLQAVLDCFSRHVWGRLYTSKLPLTAVQVLNNDVLPFFDEHGVRVRTVLSDNGREFCGRPDQHPYELFLQLEEIEHRTTKVRRPQSNGFIERFHRTLLDEHLRVKGRTTWYETVDEMQTDLDIYLETYNRARPHRGRGMEGKTPYQVFKAGIPKAKKAAKTPLRKEDANAA